MVHDYTCRVTWHLRNRVDCSENGTRYQEFLWRRWRTSTGGRTQEGSSTYPYFLMMIIQLQLTKSTLRKMQNLQRSNEYEKLSQMIVMMKSLRRSPRRPLQRRSRRRLLQHRLRRPLALRILHRRAKGNLPGQRPCDPKTTAQTALQQPHPELSTSQRHQQAELLRGRMGRRAMLKKMRTKS